MSPLRLAIERAKNFFLMNERWMDLIRLHVTDSEVRVITGRSHPSLYLSGFINKTLPDVILPSLDVRISSAKLACGSNNILRLHASRDR